MSEDRRLEVGRVRQKQRTRVALIEAARRLVAEGQTPTVEDAAAAAAISRTTAYRYFRNQADLLAAAHPEIERSTLLPDDAPRDVALRLDAVVKQITQTVVAGETQYRTMLRLSLEPKAAPRSLLLRQGRAIGWIEDALAPLRDQMPKSQLKRLVFAIRTAIGIEALVWLTDVAGLSRPDAVKTMRWSAGALLRAAMAEQHRALRPRTGAPLARLRRRR